MDHPLVQLLRAIKDLFNHSDSASAASKETVPGLEKFIAFVATLTPGEWLAIMAVIFIILAYLVWRDRKTIFS